MNVKKSKNLVIYFCSTDPVSGPYDGLRERASKRQNELLSYLSEDVGIFICRYYKYYHGDNYFSPEFQRIQGKWEKIKPKKIYADLVLGFGFGEQIVSNVYPNPIIEITNDKSVASKIFPRYFVPHILCHTYEEIQQNFLNIKSQIKVIKPLVGSQGKGILIGKDLPKKQELIDECYPYMIQEFIDTSHGFYGHSGIHDFRVVILDGKIIGKVLRQPSRDSYLANTALGGTLTDLWNFDIPEEMNKIIEEIDDYCNKYDHRYYSIDFGIGKNGEIKIFELNSAPALSTSHIAQSLGKYIARNLI